MRFLRQLLPYFILLLLLVAAWLYWWRPQKVDMAAYVPADAIVYLEANNLPSIAAGVAETDAWKALSPPAGMEVSARKIDWLTSLAAHTGIGSAEAVVLSRAQIAVVMLGIDAAEAGETLKIKPRIALVAETHTGAGRTRAAVQKLVGDFARKAYGDPDVRNEEVNGAQLTTWSARGSERKIVAAVTETIAIVGNDEASVRACLAVHRGERPSLAGNAQLEEMRRRVDSSDALAFGYVSQGGAARLLEVAATLYAGQISDDARAQSAAASLLLPLANKILGGAGWSTRVVGGAVEDHYFLALQNGMAARLHEPFAPSSDATSSASEFLPAGTYSLTRYNYRDPAAAWKGLSTALSAQGGIIEYGIITRLLNESLKPYGIEEPEKFLNAIGPEIVTARLDDAGGSTVTLVEVREEKALRDFTVKRLGAGAHTERIGEAEMLVSREAERGAAAFIAGHLLMGAADNVRRCLEARKEGRTLMQTEAFRRATGSNQVSARSSVLTYSEEEKAALTFMLSLAAQRGAREQPFNRAEFDKALAQLPYATSETVLAEDGFEKRTRSSFGQFGTLTTQFAPNQ